MTNYTKVAIVTFFDDKEDMFANSFTPLTEYDIEWYGYEWGEEIKSIL